MSQSIPEPDAFDAQTGFDEEWDLEIDQPDVEEDEIDIEEDRARER